MDYDLQKIYDFVGNDSYIKGKYYIGRIGHLDTEEKEDTNIPLGELVNILLLVF